MTDSKSYTKVSFDFGNLPYLTNPRHSLDLRAVGIDLIQLPPNEGYTFTHNHAEQEEVYIVVEGRGVILVDSELIEITRGDIVRVSPQARRALKSVGEAPLFVVCAGYVPQGYPKNVIRAI